MHRKALLKKRTDHLTPEGRARLSASAKKRNANPAFNPAVLFDDAQRRLYRKLRRSGISRADALSEVKRSSAAQSMREGDVMVVHRLPRNQPGKLPEGFKISETTNTHHARFAVNATKIERAR